jgi:hypothetical protein
MSFGDKDRWSLMCLSTDSPPFLVPDFLHGGGIDTSIQPIASPHLIAHNSQIHVHRTIVTIISIYSFAMMDHLHMSESKGYRSRRPTNDSLDGRDAILTTAVDCCRVLVVIAVAGSCIVVPVGIREPQTEASELNLSHNRDDRVRQGAPLGVQVATTEADGLRDKCYHLKASYCPNSDTM